MRGKHSRSVKSQSSKARAQAKRLLPEAESTLTVTAEKSASLERLDGFPRTFGEPPSQQRTKWASKQWVTNNKELRNALERFGNKEDWISYATDILAGYYVSVCLDALEDITTLPQAVQGLFLDKAVERNADITTMTIDMRREILQNIAEDMVDERERARKIKKRKNEVYDIRTLEDIDLGTWTGKSTFTCEGFDGSVRKIMFPSNRSLFRRKSQYSRRMLKFYDDGISVKDEHGQVMYASDCPKVGVGIPVDRLDEFAENLKWLWEQAMAVRRACGPATKKNGSLGQQKTKITDKLGHSNSMKEDW